MYKNLLILCVVLPTVVMGAERSEQSEKGNHKKLVKFLRSNVTMTVKSIRNTTNHELLLTSIGEDSTVVNIIGPQSKNKLKYVFNKWKEFTEGGLLSAGRIIGFSNSPAESITMGMIFLQEKDNTLTINVIADKRFSLTYTGYKAQAAAMGEKNVVRWEQLPLPASNASIEVGVKFVLADNKKGDFLAGSTALLDCRICQYKKIS